MILSSPFSRHNRSHQTWTNGHTSNFSHSHHPHLSPPHQHHHQKQQSLLQHHKIPQASAGTTPRKPQVAPQEQLRENFARSSTLNRLDFQSCRPQSARGPPSGGSGSMLKLATTTPATARTDLIKNGLPERFDKIYAPASIASPYEFHSLNGNNNKYPLNDSHHYAVTSFKGETPFTTASESGRSGRESALGSLIGTIRRKVSTKWTSKNQQQQQAKAEVNERNYKQQIPIDPEIYANGKRELQAEEIYAEGLQAIDSNAEKRKSEPNMDDSNMVEGEFRTIIEEQSRKQADFLALVCVLTNWINDELAHQRIIVRELYDDLHDGQILGKLIEKLHCIQLDLVEVTQNEILQKNRLKTVLSTINRVLSTQARWASIRWSVEGIYSKNMIELLHLLITLTRYYKAPVKLPPYVKVNVIVLQKFQGQLLKRSHEIQLTDSNISSMLSAINERDAFDILFEVAPEKLDLVKRSLVKFCNRHLNRINMSCSSSSTNSTDSILDPDNFSDGLLLVFLIASFEDYFVPLGNLFTTIVNKSTAYNQLEQNSDNYFSIQDSHGKLQTAIEETNYINTQPLHKLHNVNIAFQLMDDAGINVRDKTRAEDIVNGDLKSVLRVLYALFSRYKHL